MVSIHCPRHGSRVLLSDRHVRALHNTRAGIVLEVECDDGARVHVVTGRAAGDARAAGQLVMSLVANRRRASSPNSVA